MSCIGVFQPMRKLPGRVGEPGSPDETAHDCTTWSFSNRYVRWVLRLTSIRRTSVVVVNGVSVTVSGKAACPSPSIPDRKSVVQGKSVSVRVDLGGRRIIKKKKKK